MAALCALCKRPVGDGFLCTSCTDQLATDLTAITELLIDLEITRTRRDRLGAAEPHRTATHDALPWKEHAADAYWTLAVTVLCWCRTVLDANGTATLHTGIGDTAGRWAAWLAGQVRRIRSLPLAGDCADEIGAAVDWARRAIDLPPTLTFVGPCDAQLAGTDRCPVDLYAAVHGDTVTCPSCGTEHNLDRRHAYLLAQAQEYLAPLPTISRALSLWLERPVTPSMLRGYVHRNRLFPRGTDRQGRHLFRLGDAAKIVVEVDRAKGVG